MRHIRHFFLVIVLAFSSIAYADAACEKIKDYVSENLDTSGVLKQDAAGFVYIDLDDDYIHKLNAFISDDGFEEVPYFYQPDGHGAHISVIYAKEAEEYCVGKVAEVGKTFFFKIKNCQMVRSLDKEYYIIAVDAPILNNIRKKYGLPKAKYDFHITIGVKSVASQAA